MLVEFIFDRKQIESKGRIFIMQIIYALIAMCLNAANDIVYRKYSVLYKRNSLYTFYFMSAFFSMMVAALTNFVLYRNISFEIINITYGVALGVLSFFTYFFFLKGFASENSYINVTIFRLNIVPGILIALIFLNENLSVRRGIGITLCIISVVLFYEKSIGKSNFLNKYFFFSTIACFFGGILNAVNKVALIHGASSLKLLFWRFLSVGIMAIAIVIVKKSWNFKDIVLVKYSFLSGVLLLAAIFFILTALKNGEVIMLIPITQLSFVIVNIICWFFFKEKTNFKKIIGVILAIISIFIIY